MFHDLLTTATHEHLQGLKDADIKWLAPYVQCIYFRPGRHSWKTNFEDYEEMALSRALFLLCEKNGNDKDDLFKYGIREYIWNFLDGKSPITQRKLRNGYALYLNHAKETERLYSEGHFQALWIKIPRMLPRAKKLVVGYWDFRGTEDPEEDHWNFSNHNHALVHSTRTCEELQAPVGEALLQSVFSALSQINIAPVELGLEHYAGVQYSWAENGALQNLDLSHIRKLVFCPQNEELHGEV